MDVTERILQESIINRKSKIEFQSRRIHLDGLLQFSSSTQTMIQMGDMNRMLNREQTKESTVQCENDLYAQKKKTYGRHIFDFGQQVND